MHQLPFRMRSVFDHCGPKKLKKLENFCENAVTEYAGIKKGFCSESFSRTKPGASRLKALNLNVSHGKVVQELRKCITCENAVQRKRL